MNWKTWKETVLLPTLARYSVNDIYNGDETALFYKSLPHRMYCFDGDKPAGFVKHKDRLTLLIITNMDGSDHRTLSVIGKSKNPIACKKVQNAGKGHVCQLVCFQECLDDW